MKHLIFLIWLLALPLLLPAQEFQCEVNVSTPQLTTVDPQVFQELKSSWEDVYNNTRWTDVRYESAEKIKVSFQINILSDNDRNTFEADVQIQATRPVYGSNYKTVLMTFVDKGVKFKFEPFQPLQKSTNSFVNGLSSLISFYAYMILGFDYDTFIPEGGNDYFQIAQEISNTIPSGQASSMGGWRGSDANNQGRNRFSLLENMLNSRMVPFREALYLYHRKGLDLMHRNPVEGRTNIMEALRKIKTANEDYFNSLVIQMFCNSKRDELIEIFKGAPREERLSAHSILVDIDSGNSEDYNELSS